MELSNLIAQTELWDLDPNSEWWRPDGTIVTFEACSYGEYHVIQRQAYHDETRPLVVYFESLRSIE